MEYLTLGKIIDTFSLDGTLKVFSSTNNQKKRYQEGNTLILFKDEQSVELHVSSYRSSGNIDFVKFDELNNPEEAKQYVGYEIRVMKDEKDLDEGYYFYSDLRGCKVLKEDKTIIGKVKQVEEFPAQITLRCVSEQGKDFFVPFIKEFVLNVDIKNKEITIKYMEGML